MALKRLVDSEVTPSITAAAKKIRDAHWQDPIGSQFPFEADGKKYVGLIEQHYHPPGGGLRPWGYHHGVSIFRVVDATSGVLVTTSANGYRFSTTSLARLATVDKRLQSVVRRALEITTIDFSVICGIRTLDEQRKAYASGASMTMNSRHLTGHAVDLAPFVGGKISWDWDHYRILAPYVKSAAKELSVPIEWGGDWPDNPPLSRKDGPHWQLPWAIK